MKLETDPDRAFRQLDDEAQYKYLLLESPAAEFLFPKQYLDLDLDPYQVFSLKALRGRFHSQAEVDQFIDQHDMHWLFDNGYIMHNGKPGFSPYYFDQPGLPGVPNVCILWPASFGKTTVVCGVLPVMSVCDNPNARLQYIGKNETEAFSFSTDIRRKLALPNLVNDFGRFHPEDRDVPWSHQAFSVNQRQWRDVRENFEFYGTNSHAELGKRSDQAYLDDIETPDTVGTDSMRAKFMEWLHIGPLTSAQPAFPRDANNTVLIPKRYRWSSTARYWGTGVVGTIFHPEGVYALLHRDPTFTCIKFDCFKDKKCSISLMPSKMSVAQLDAKRESLGTLAFNKRYRNIAFNPEEMAFREDWVRGRPEMVNGVNVEHPGCLDRDRSFGEVREGEEVFFGFDPASGSKSRWSAYAAFCGLAYDRLDKKRYLYLVDFKKLQDGFDRMLDWLLDGNPEYGIEGFHSKYNYTYATVEKNAFGKWMIDNDRTKPLVQSGIVRPHYCVDTETQVLSRRGWLNHDEVLLGDEILTLSTKSGASEWRPVYDKYVGTHEGEMHRIESRSIDALCTIDHKWPIQRQDSDELYLCESRYVGTGHWTPLARPLADDVSSPHSDDLVRIVGWAVTEGHFRPNRRTICIGQSPTVNPSHCAEIRETLQRLEATWHESENGNGTLVFGIGGQLALDIRSVTENGKNLPPSFIASLSRNQRDILHDTLIKADGWIQGTNHNLCSDSASILSGYEMLCALRGYSTNRYYRRDDVGHGVVCQRVSRDARIQPWRQSIEWSGTIWCPSTANGTFYAKRNGKTYFTGNTGSNKTDPESGVFAMGEMVENGRLRIPYKTPADQSKAEEFIADLLLFPKGTNDLVMSLWLAQVPIRSLSTQYRSWFTPRGKGTYVRNPAYE